MRTINKKIALYLTIALILFAGCKDEEDSRTIEPAKIVALNIDGKLYASLKYSEVGSSNLTATCELPPGVSLQALKTTILLTNGQLTNFANNETHDFRKPINVDIMGENGERTTWQLAVKSAPELQRLTIEGMNIPQRDVHFGKTTIVVQVPKGTDISKLAVNLTFANGSLKNYTNGTVKDYTTPFALEVLSIDEINVYTYDLMFTQDPVGPASIRGIIVNGTESDSATISNNVIQPYFTYLSDFSTADISLQTGFGNTIDPSFVATNRNLLEDIYVKVTGTNGVSTEFTIKTPLVLSTPIMEKTHTALEFAANAGSSAAFSGDKILIASHAMNAGAEATFGINAYDLSGNYIKGLSKTGTNFDAGAVTGIRKFATDAEGNILGVQLGAGAGAETELTIYKWEGVDDDKPSAFIKFSQASLGLAYAPRTAGINIAGSLSGNATITVPIAQKQDVMVWKVTNGVLDPTPKQLTFPYSGRGYYYSVEALGDGFIGASTGAGFNGISLLNNTMTENGNASGIVTSDIKTLAHKGRTYAAYVAIANGRHNFRIIDITNSNAKALQTPIMNIVGGAISNGNNTVDADFSIINGKLHVLFFGTNDKVAVYKLEP